MSSGISPGDLNLLIRLVSDHPDPVRVVGPDGRVLFRNNAARPFPEDGLGHLCREERRGTDASCPACQIERVFREGRFMRWHISVPGPRSDDATAYYEIGLCPLRDEEETVTAVVEFLRDDTASLGVQNFLIGEAERQDEELQRRAEEASQLQARAESLRSDLRSLRESQAQILHTDRLMALGRLVASVAHEVHTPLGAILSSVDLLRRTVPRLRESRDPERNRDLEAMESACGIIAEGGRRIERVVRSLRLFSRLDEAPVKKVDLHEGLDSTLALLRYRMGEEIRVVRDYGRVPPVTCRPDALNQVFMNLLSNAIQAIPGEGEVRVRTFREGDRAVVEVSDTGIGIPKSDLERVFEAGFTTRKRGVGTGLGLAICRRIVEEHDGSIELASAPGKGTTFRITLPITPSRGDS